MAAVLLNWPVESSPRSWLWMRWMLSLAAISLPFSMPALERSEPEDWGCILVAEAYFSSMTDGRPCSVVLGVSSTIPLGGWGRNCSSADHVWRNILLPKAFSNDHIRIAHIHKGIWRAAEVLPVHSELGSDPVKTQSHEGHMRHALIGAWRWPFLHGNLQEAKVHLHEREPEQNKQTKWSDMSRPSCGTPLFKNVLMLQTLITQR